MAEKVDRAINLNNSCCFSINQKDYKNAIEQACEALSLIEQPLLTQFNTTQIEKVRIDQVFCDRFFILLLTYFNYGQALIKS
jgi:hypothetical protein